jgi:glycerol transport system ATP-binding protein
MARIVLDDLAHSYRPHPAGPDDYALKRIHTVWEDGGAYALLGPSGCGKTTLLNIISGLLIPSQGRVLYGETDVTRLPPEKRNIAQVFQFPVLYDTMTVRENLSFPLRNRGVSPSDTATRVMEVAQALDLVTVLDAKASGLSADAKQKISLGRGLVRSDVAAILFDEPLTVIDPHLKWQLRRKLKEIHDRFKLTLIYVTHDQVEAMTFADQVVVMFDGEIVQIGTPQDLFENPEHTFVGYFIGSPGMNLLPVTVDGEAALTGSSRIPLTPALAGKARAAAAAGAKLELGIRPMYLGLEDAGVDHGVAARINLVEDQGDCRIVTVSMGDVTVKARVPEGRAIPSQEARAVFPPEWTRIFADGRLLK